MLEESARFFFLQLVLRSDVAEQFTVAAMLHNQEQSSWRFDNLVQLDDMGMPHNLENVDLATDSFHVVHVGYLAFLKNFDCNL